MAKMIVIDGKRYVIEEVRTVTVRTTSGLAVQTVPLMTAQNEKK